MRSCEDCSECCKGILSFEEDNIIVRDNITCYKLSNEKCSIYEERPKTCKDFSCTFLLDTGLPEWLRPNQCGFILSERPDRIIIDQCKDKFIKAESLIWILWWASNYRKMNVELKSYQYGHYMFTYGANSI